jgi:DNA topoisomerase-1
MAVESFLKPTDAKITIEKPVKEKPKLKDLITIERPGKPMPALNLLEEPHEKTTKKHTPKKRATSDNIKEITKKDSILIITEKPQAANKIAHALSDYPNKYSDNNVSYFELEHNNEKIIVASAVGHLFNLTYKQGQKGWPIFELEWIPSYSKTSSAFTKRYFDLLKKLSKRAKDFIVATDYDTEGEVIGWNVLRFICNQNTAKRMKYSTLTKNELLNSFENPLPTLDWGQAYAGESRHILDWLYGINLSRALMSAIKTSGSFKILSIGRVQGPALKIIVDREEEIKAFEPEPFWQVIAKIKEAPEIEFKHPKDIFNKKELEPFKKIKQAIAKTEKRNEKIPPPAPFDLTTLQREAYRWHNISPSQTLQIAQKLYLDGVISYPRTSSQKIPEAIQPKNILKELTKQFPEQVKFAKREKPIEGNKSDPAHPSIYPTGEIPKQLETKEQHLYNLIAKRFISCFCPDAETENKKITLTPKENKELIFTASGLVVKEKGWTNVYIAKFEEINLPDINRNVTITKIDFLEKETQPPKRYTPTSLITALEKINLGTKATRSMIVDTLFERGYLDGKSIQATPLGMHLIESLKQYSPIIIDENLTRKLEEEMEDIQTSKKDFQEKESKVISNAKKIIIDISKDFKTKEVEIGKALLKGIETQRQEQQESNLLPKTCPKCNNGYLRITYSPKTKRSFISCNNYPKCTNTYTLPPNGLMKKAEKDCEECKWPKLMSIRKGKRPWEFCFNPDCPINKKRREEWEKKQQKAQG